MPEGKTPEELAAEAADAAEVAEVAAREAADAEAREVQIKKEEEAAAAAAAESGGHKKTAQERIDEITYKFREAERQAKYWEGVALEAEGGGEPSGPAGGGEPVPVVDPSVRPESDNFETVAEYEDALFDWYDHKKVAKGKAENQATEMKNNVDTFNKNAEPFRKEHPDFNVVLDTPVFSDAMRSILFTMESGPEVAYYIAKNKEVSAEFQGLSPAQQIYKISKLENTLALAHKTRTVTGAPVPFKKSGDTAHNEIDPDDMTTEQWMAWDKERTLKRIEEEIGA